MGSAATYVEYFEGVQSEFLKSLTLAQDLHFKSIASFGECVELPNSVATVEQAFNFTSQILESQQSFVMTIAELVTDVQNEFVGAAKRATETTRQHLADVANKPATSVAKQSVTATKNGNGPGKADSKPMAEASKN